MAYERTWQFIPMQGPRVAVSTADSLAYMLWMLKSILLGQVGGATQGLWTLVLSCDGATTPSSADQWTTTFDAAKIPNSTLAASGAKGWMILKRTWGAQDYFLVLCNGGTGVSGAPTLIFYTTPCTNGTTTQLPSNGVLHGGYFSGTTPLYSSDVTNSRRFYAALSTTGDFWFAQSILGELATGVLCAAVVGAKSNDQFPVYTHANEAPFSINTYGHPFFGYNFFKGYGSQVAARYYNGAAGFHNLAQPDDVTALDPSDNSVFAWPAWVLSMTGTSGTGRASRGRLADMGVCGYVVGNYTPAGNRPVNVGSTIKDAASVVRYVVLNHLIVPYNAALS